MKRDGPRNIVASVLNEPVAIEFTPAQTSDVAFACGMNMLKGVIIVIRRLLVQIAAAG